MADSASESARIGPYPISGSIFFTVPIMVSSTFGGSPVRNPAWPIMDFSISALHGQTVMQCPHETHEEPAITSPPSHSTRGCSDVQSIVRVSFTCTFWQASTHRPQRMH